MGKKHFRVRSLDCCLIWGGKSLITMSRKWFGRSKSIPFRKVSREKNKGNPFLSFSQKRVIKLVLRTYELSYQQDYHGPVDEKSQSCAHHWRCRFRSSEGEKSLIAVRHVGRVVLFSLVFSNSFRSVGRGKCWITPQRKRTEKYNQKPMIERNLSISYL